MLPEEHIEDITIIYITTVNENVKLILSTDSPDFTSRLLDWSRANLG